MTSIAAPTSSTSERTADLPPGPGGPAADVRPAGFRDHRGLLSRDLLLGAGVASDLLGPGDLPPCRDDDADPLLPVESRWSSAAEQAAAREELRALLARTAPS